MRFLVVVTLFFYCVFNLHISFDDHVQVFCVEKNGHSEVETYALAHSTIGPALHATSLESSKPGNCEDCTDYFIGSGHPDDQGFLNQSAANFNEDLSFDLQKISLTLAPKPLTAVLKNTPPLIYPPPLFTFANILTHIPSTVLLI